MKRLFQVSGFYFDTKFSAKLYRDMQNNNTGSTFTVGLGPDHRLYGVKKPGRTHSHNARSGGAGNGFPNKKRH